MRRAGVAKTAAHFRSQNSPKGGRGGRPPAAAQNIFTWSGPGDKESHSIRDAASSSQLQGPTRQILRTIYHKWQRQIQRWADYRSLFSLMAFIAVFLGVLYAQRGATVGYQVHSTIAAVVLPQSSMLQSTADVYAWLQNLLQTVWVDPICGDGTCEAPFEFASFSRFGCKADCGRLSDVQHLTSAQVDVYWDFSHAAASLPAAELMRQASWNLCPQDIQYNTACYADPDNTFSSIAGSSSSPMPDLPDGDWALVLKKDIFQKTAGAVRDSTRLSQAAFWYKVYIAAAAATAEHAFEVNLLNQALRFLQTSLLDALPAVWAASGQGSTYDAFNAAQMRNASCLCGASVRTPLLGTPFYVDEATYLASNNCTGITQLGDRSTDIDGNITYSYSLAPIPRALCDAAAANMAKHLGSYNSTILSLLASQRLGDLKTTGKFALRGSVAGGLRAFLLSRYPELVSAVYVDPRGADPSEPAAATLDALTSLFVDSQQHLVTGAPASLALYRRRLVGDTNISFAEYAARARARITEIAQEQASVAALPIKGPDQTATVSQVRAAFAAAGANTTWLPAAPALGPLAVDYNLATWGGNTTAYLTCNLDIRGPEYLGRCVAMPVSCTSNPVDSRPYNCTKLDDSSVILGSISNATYRQGCELPCDMQQDCNTLCECWTDCGANSYCSCDACEALAPDAASDSQFFTIRNAAASSGAATANIIAGVNPQGGSRRRLQQTAADVTNQLADVLLRVDSLKDAQAGVTGQLNALQSQVDKANLLAEARAASTTIQDLIAAGRADIQSGQQALEGKLDLLLKRQQAAIDAMNAANSQLAALQSMSQKQADALAALDVATNDRLNAISVATQQGIINLYQALAVWKLARRERLLSTKITKLAGSPCSYEPISIPFSVNNSNDAEPEAARERTLGLNNRVLAGMLLHTWRTSDKACPNTRFSQIQARCASDKLDVTPYGVDSVFKLGSINFNPDLYDPDGNMMLSIYNCSQLPKPTYNVYEPTTKLVTNSKPYCAELYNPRGVPYAFRHLPLPGLPAGHPVYLDINLSQEGAQTWLSWLQEGLMLDQHTRGMVAHVITYNSELKVFGAVKVEFDFQQGGSIKVSNSIYTLSLELYTPTAANLARYAFEILLAGGIVLLAALQLLDILRSLLTAKGRRQGGLTGYLSHGSTWVQLANNALLLAGVGLWWTFVNSHAKTFSMDLRYPVYSSLQPQAYFLQLADEGAGLNAAWSAFGRMQDAIAVLNWYYALNGISILLLIARLLRAMDFQPRLGVVTRALQLAAPDLLHFFLVAGSVFLCYCVMGFLIFGNSLPWFATLGTSINTCFEMLLGEFADVNTDLRALGGLQGVAGVLYFWSFMILVFLILLNFLLAIIVDAFSEIKNSTKERTGIHVELSRLLLDKWRWLVGIWSRRYVGASKLDALMKDWAGVEEEEEALAAAEAQAAAAAGKGDGDADSKEPRVLQVLGETVDEATLTQVLLAVLDQPDDPKAAAAQMQGVAVTEVEAAAHYIVRRYGKSTRKVAEQALQELGPGGRELEEERNSLAAALERLAQVQRELAEAQRNLMLGQKQLAEQQAQLLLSRQQQGSGSGGAGGSPTRAAGGRQSIA